MARSILWTLPLLTFLVSCNRGPKTELDKRSYASGVQIGESYKSRAVETNPSMVAQGIKDVLLGRELAMSREDIQKALHDIVLVSNENRKEIAQHNLAESLKAVDAYMKAAGVTPAPAGFLYRVIKAGHGQKPNKESKVRVHYTGKLIDGKIFDSSVMRGQPARFLLRDILPGWREALLMMPVGSTWEIMLPPHLAYGESGNAGIPPNSALLFEIELQAIEN